MFQIRITTLLKAGIIDSELIVVSNERHEQCPDESLPDCSNIIAVQNIHRSQMIAIKIKSDREI
jgi:hypothetical protein